jgi:thiol-disulfide isomerase/thioredoxin
MKSGVLLMGCIVAMGIASCTTSPSGSAGSGNYASISGNIQNAGGQTILLQKFVKNRPVSIDSAVVASDGSFEINPKEALPLNFYSLKLPEANTFCIFIADSTQEIEIKGEAGSLDKQVEVSGSKDSEALQAFYLKMNGLKNNRETIVKSLDATTEQSELTSKKGELIALDREKREFCVQFINQHLPSPAVLAALSELDIVQDMEMFVRVKNDLSKNFAHSEYYSMVSTQIENAKRQQQLRNSQQQQQQQQAASGGKGGAFANGQLAPDIAMADTEGKTRKLSDLKGKVVLIDFWASWCGPCRRENPNVVNLYKKYQKDGFEVFSVSLDKTAEPWLKAIQTDGLIWKNHVSDLKGWQNAAAQQYGVNSIPHTLLIDKEGKILGTGLRGAALEQALKQQFGR